VDMKAAEGVWASPSWLDPSHRTWRCQFQRASAFLSLSLSPSLSLSASVSLRRQNQEEEEEEEDEEERAAVERTICQLTVQAKTLQPFQGCFGCLASSFSLCEAGKTTNLKPACRVLRCSLCLF